MSLSSVAGVGAPGARCGRVALVQGLQEHVLRLLGHARAGGGVGNDRAHRQFEPDHAFEVHARLVKTQRRQARTTAQRCGNGRVAQGLRDALGTLGKARRIEGREPARDQRAGFGEQRVGGVGNGSDLRQRSEHGANRRLEAGEVVAGNADEEQLRRGCEQLAARIARGRERGAGLAQFGAPARQVVQGQGQAPAQQARSRGFVTVVCCALHLAHRQPHDRAIIVSACPIR